MKVQIKSSTYASDLDKLYDMLVEHGVATEDEVNLVTSINGYNQETFEAIMYARTGRNFEQFMLDMGLDYDE